MFKTVTYRLTDPQPGEQADVPAIVLRERTEKRVVHQHLVSDDGSPKLDELGNQLFGPVENEVQVIDLVALTLGGRHPVAMAVTGVQAGTEPGTYQG